MRTLTRQHGGTVVGLIVGLIIGLGIAVGVAITIKNTPLPFTNKQGSSARRVDPATGLPSDPNSPLYGNKAASKEAAREFARKLEEEAAKRKAAAEQAPQHEPDGIDALLGARSKATTTLPATPPPRPLDNDYTYFLQAGAFLSQNDAENTKGNLALLGLNAHITESKTNNGTMYRVRLGPFAEQEAMNRARGQLSDNGVDVAVVRLPK